MCYHNTFLVFYMIFLGGVESEMCDIFEKMFVFYALVDDLYTSRTACPSRRHSRVSVARHATRELQPELR